MEIDYTEVIINHVGPKLAYHGFKYNKKKSHSLIGSYMFTRIYWGEKQHVIIGRVEYNIEDMTELVATDDDLPTEVPSEVMLIQEPNFRLWLSNKYIVGILSHEYGSISVGRDGITGMTPFTEPADTASNSEATPTRRGVEKKREWWEFHSEAELRKVLHDMVEIILTEGLEWFEQQVANTRRYHEKLDARRKADRERRERDKTKIVN